MSGSDREQSRSSSPLPWKEMFESASSSPLLHQTPGSLRATRSASAVAHPFRTIEADSQRKKDSRKPPFQFKDDDKESSQVTAEEKVVREPSLKSTNLEAAPGKLSSDEDDRSVNFDTPASRLLPFTELPHESSDPYRQLAVHIAMAHAFLIFLIVVLYGIWKLLECYRRPIQWAVICSMPLRAVHGTIVEFWKRSLKQGLLGTVLAIPFAFCRALILTVLDAKFAVMHLTGKHQSQAGRTVKFTTLTEWLVSFAVMTLAFESMGAISLAVVPFIVIVLYSFGMLLGLVPEIEDLQTESKRSLLSNEPSHRWEQARSWLDWVFLPITKIYRFLGSRITSALLNNLHHLVAIFLMVLMILGSLSGLVLFSYKIGYEGKGVVIALKTHVERSNYIEKVGLRQWMEDNQVPELIDTYAGKAYDTVSSQIDTLAAKYQMTELADAGKQYLIGIAHGQRRKIMANSSNFTVEDSSDNAPAVPSHPLVDRARSLMQRFREYDMNGAYVEIQQSGVFLLEYFNIPKEELLERAKQAGERWLGVGRHVFANGSKVAYAVLRLFISGASMILSGAPELISFCADSFIFFTFLHYLVVSKSGGVMEQMLSLLPLSDSTRVKCAVVLDHAVSSVLLATVKAASFQAMFTWLFFRVLKIHFLYMCTLLAFISAVLPIIPTWWSSVPAGIQFAIEGRYISAVVLMASHIGLMDYGVAAIQRGIPGHNAYLTGLSLAGGMALFPSAIEGAIMGPLLMTVAISLKDLYMEFVLTNAKKRA